MSGIDWRTSVDRAQEHTLRYDANSEREAIAKCIADLRVLAYDDKLDFTAILDDSYRRFLHIRSKP